jgi:Zn finger protein HypA/HybF involved in hydrogenase expression
MENKCEFCNRKMPKKSLNQYCNACSDERRRLASQRFGGGLTIEEASQRYVFVFKNS